MESTTFTSPAGPRRLEWSVSDSPAGPWRDPLRKPLIAQHSTPTLARDPGILQEEDGTSYLIFGCWDYYIAKLNPDMISLAETPRLLQLDRKMGPYGPGKLDDKPYLHKRGGFYYLSWGCYYAMSKDVYGPYEYRDCFIKSESTAPEFRPRLTYDRHGSFFRLFEGSPTLFVTISIPQVAALTSATPSSATSTTAITGRLLHCDSIAWESAGTICRGLLIKPPRFHPR